MRIKFSIIMELLRRKKLLIGTIIMVAIITAITIKLTTAEEGVNISDKNTLNIPDIEMGGEVYDPNISINKDPLFEDVNGIEVDVGFIEDDVPEEEADVEIIDKRKEEIENRDNDAKKVYERQKGLIDSGELQIGEETNIIEGIISEDDIVEWGNKVIPTANLSTEQAIGDIKVALGKETYDYKALRSDFEGEKLEAFDKDYEQLITDPYSSPDLTRAFDIYKKSGQLDYFVSCVGAWLMNGGDDGVAHTKLD
jgi:hypothetical protein